MDTPAPDRSDDLSALAWVQGELRKSLETANKALRRYLKEAEAASGSDVDAVDPAILRTARTHLHQGVGALELVGMPAVADVLRASEAAVQRMVSRPAMVDSAAVDTVERVSFALLDFLTRQLSGKPVSPVMLFPQYRSVLQLAAADRIHPADLWKIDFQWRELPRDRSAVARQPDEAARGDMETMVLALMRQTAGNSALNPGSASPALARMSDLCADLGAGARAAAYGGSFHLATFWQLAAAVFQAQASGLLTADVYAKRIASRLLAQLRMQVRGQGELSDRLAQDLLFFCSHAKPPAAAQPTHGMATAQQAPGTAAAPPAPRLSAVRQAWRLADLPTADYEVPRLGRFDPAVMALARKRVAAAKDSWSAVAGGELHRMTNLAEQFTLVGESLQRLFPAGEVLAQSLQTAVTQTVASADAPPAPLAMEVATGILYLDASLEDGEFDHPELPERVQRLARRIDDVRIGAEPQPLDVWMEELYRRVSDRQTMGSVVQELRVALSEIEKQIDQYFRDPTQRQLLIPVPAQLSAMRSVLSVLGLEQASAAALHMRDDVDALAQTEVDPHQAIQAGTFDRLADNLGALSFLIDMLSVQPALAKSLFRFDPDTGSLSAVMGQSERVSAFAAFDDAPPAAAEPAAVPAQPSSQTPSQMPLPGPSQTPSQVPLLEQLQALAALAAQPEVSDDQLAGRIEPLAQQAFAAEQPELARLLAGAQRTLRLHGNADDAAARQSVRSELIDAVAALGPPPAPEVPPSAPIPPARPAMPGGTGLEDDAEMRDIFIEESREVIANARAALARLARAADGPDAATDMTAVRRAFHTLKGSARMVGLRDFGDAGWACEQLYNARLAQGPQMDAALRQFTEQALGYMGDWAEAIAAGQNQGHSAADVAHAADALRNSGVRLDIAAPAVLAAEPVVPDNAAGLAAAAPADTPATTPAASPAQAVEVADGIEVAPAALAPVAFAEPVPALEPVPAAQPGPPLLSDEDAALVADPRSAPPPLAADDLQVLDFDFDLPDDDAPLQTAAPAPEPLTARVPGLPSAQDLDLGGFDVAPPPAAAPAVSADEPAFDLDLSAFDGPDQPAPQPSLGDSLIDLPLDAPAVDAPLPLPLPEGETLEIEFDDLDGVFAAPAEPAPPLPVLDAAPLELEAGATAEPALVDERPLAALPADAAPAEAVSDGGDSDGGDDDQVKRIGPLRIGIPLFNIYLNEADELSRRLSTELAEWSHEDGRHPVPDSSVALAHSLAGSSATVGYADLSALARGLEHALLRSHSQGPGRAGEPALFNDAADEIRRLLHQFAAGFLRPVDPGLMERLAAHERLPVEAQASERGEAPFEPANEAAFGLEEPPANGAPTDGIDAVAAVDTIDAELFPIFEEEADELLPQLQTRLRDWQGRPADHGAAMACMRTLHTLKGGARLSGAMRLGDMAHRLEAAIEALAARGDVLHRDVDPLVAQADAMSAAFEQLRKPGVPATAAAPGPVSVPPQQALHIPAPQAFDPLPQALEAPLPALDPKPQPLDAAQQDSPASADHPSVAEAAPAALDTTLEPAAQTPDVTSETAPETAQGTARVAAPGAAPGTAPETAEDSAPPEAAPEVVDTPPAPTPPPAQPAVPAPAIDWQRFKRDETPAATAEPATTGGGVVRVRTALLDRLVNDAGEVSITRARIDADVKLLQHALADLTDSLERMRRQLRDIEVQAETQISSRLEAAKLASQSFDPLEMDRFTRFQELTRFMAESVNDVATLQRSLQRTLQSTEDELAAQARLTRELQDDLLRTRMVEFDSLADRLHRTARQAAKETGKQVALEIVGGAIEVDRGVLERMAGPFEHLLRNSVVHGIEPPAARAAAGKSAAGAVTVTVAQAGNEVAVDIADDGAGLDLPRIRARAVERGVLQPDALVSDAELAELVFRPGFSTADTVTELAGRGVGLDVVRAEVIGMGGRVETHSDAGRGTRFKLLLPLTTAVTQVVMLRCGTLQVAVPSTLIEIVRRAPNADVARAYAEGTFADAGDSMPFFWLAALLRAGSRGDATAGRTQTVVIIRSAAQRVAVHVDEVVGNQEVVVKNVGPQLARLPGLAGVTLLPSGAVALIYNPVALATLYGDAARERVRQAALGATGGSQGDGLQAEAEAVRAPLVMVVDDSLTVRRITQRLLQREGYRVVTAKDGLDALERLAEERPVVLLSDIEMPRMDGFDLLRNVRADARLAGLPVVMITSRTAQKHRDHAAELGADHYLGKPYSEEELLGLVARYAGADIPA